MMDAAGQALGIPEPPLGYYEDEPVWGAEHVIRGLEGGLRKAVEVNEPVAYRRKSRVTFVVDVVVEEIAYVEGKGPGDEPGLNRRHISKLALLAPIDRDIVADALDEQQRRIDEAANRKPLFDTKGNPTEPIDASPEDAEDQDDDEPLTEAEENARKVFAGANA